MSHLITGIDLGSYSVKFVVADAGFRRSQLIAAFEELVPAGEAPLEERQMQAVRRGTERIKREGLFFSALPGDRAAIRMLDIPFTDARKVDQVVPYELEAQIVQPLEEVVFDHQSLRDPIGQASVVAVAARTDDVGLTLDRMNEAGIVLRSLWVAPMVYRVVNDAVEAEVTAVAATAEDASETDPPTTVQPVERLRLLLDIGHLRTNVTVLRQGYPVFARTLLRGGRHLTMAIAETFKVEFEKAEEAKRTRATVAHAGFTPADAVEQQLAAVLREALQPLVRDIRQTVASFRGRVNVPLAGLSIVGGSAALHGLAEALSEELDLPMVPYDPERGVGAEESLVDPPDTRYALAEAMAWAGVRGTALLDLRRGPFVYKASFSVLRQRAWHIGGLALAIVLCAGFDGTMSLKRVEQQNEALKSALEEQTRELFGHPDLNARKVSDLMRKGFREELPPIPALTAFDLLGEISSRMPSKEDIKLDLLELDVRPKKTFIKGLIDSVASVDKVVDQLKEIDCFEEIQKGAITEVSGGEKQFALTVKTTCP